MKMNSRNKKSKKKGRLLKYFLFAFLILFALSYFTGVDESEEKAGLEEKSYASEKKSEESPIKNASEHFEEVDHNKEISDITAHDEQQIKEAKSKDSIANEDVHGDKEPAAEQFEVIFLDVGQGDAAIVLCDNHAMLVDGGKDTQSDKIYTVLKNRGLKTLDYIVASHPDDDHVGGLSGALNYAKAETALAPVKTDESESFKNFERSLEKQGTTITVPDVGTEYKLGSADIQILGPVELSEESNNNSLVLRIVHGNNSFLFTGDAEYKEEQDILRKETEIESTILKLAHHGSNSSTSVEWLDAVGAETAVISCGIDNIYGHPTEEILDRLKARGISIFRTDLQGDIRFYEENGVLLCEPEKNPEADVFVPGHVAENDIGITVEEEVNTLTESDLSKEEDVTRGGEKEAAVISNEHDYIVNTSTGKFHYPDCRGVKQMKEKNKWYVTCDRQELIDQGYQSCGICHP